MFHFLGINKGQWKDTQRSGREKEEMELEGGKREMSKEVVQEVIQFLTWRLNVKSPDTESHADIDRTDWLKC